MIRGTTLITCSLTGANLSRTPTSPKPITGRPYSITDQRRSQSQLRKQTVFFPTYRLTATAGSLKRSKRNIIPSLFLIFYYIKAHPPLIRQSSLSTNTFFPHHLFSTFSLIYSFLFSKEKHSPTLDPTAQSAGSVYC